MSKEIWLRGSIASVSFVRGKPVVAATCAHHDADSENVVHPEFHDMAPTVCWVKGMVNSSNNVLVHCRNGELAPIGKVGNGQHVEHGVTVLAVTHDCSRDEPVEYVRSRSDAERLVLLAQGFPGQDFTLADVCAMNRIDSGRATVKALKNLLRAIRINLAREKAQSSAAILDANILAMVGN